CFSCSEKPITVHLKGQLKGMVPAEVMRYNGTASMIGDSRDILIHTDENGYFDTIIELKKSEYFSISRNTLYLTPGDDLELVITENNQEATFSGIGAEANNYMKKRLFPKGGSFLEAGRYVRADFVRTKVTVDSLAEERRNELAGLKKVSPEFKKMEEARITADVVNSYISYASYRKDVCFDWQAYQRATPEEQEKINEEQQKLRDAHLIAVAPELNRLYKTLTDTLFLNVAVVRDVLSYFGEDQYGWFEGIELPERTKELYEAADKVEALRQAITATTVNDAKDFIAKAKYQDVVTEVRHKADQAGKLVEGQPAIDIMMTDVDGNVKRLSDFRGKVIYMDLWATWCGP
ncbi:MAG TPA: thiol-disulfide oxidoreductase, partial [Butyricimonas virosa]|nr:thiol-disulfide oxidoreductase [Butyricimonas virosa]